MLMLRRLGSVGDADEVMEQPFFAAIDWNDLKRKRITPPFRPEVRTNPILLISYILSPTVLSNGTFSPAGLNNLTRLKSCV